jgi:hypothetical protein
MWHFIDKKNNKQQTNKYALCIFVDFIRKKNDATYNIIPIVYTRGSNNHANYTDWRR